MSSSVVRRRLLASSLLCGCMHTATQSSPSMTTLSSPRRGVSSLLLDSLLRVPSLQLQMESMKHQQTSVAGAPTSAVIDATELLDSDLCGHVADRLFGTLYAYGGRDIGMSEAAAIITSLSSTTPPAASHHQQQHQITSSSQRSVADGGASGLSTDSSDDFPSYSKKSFPALLRAYQRWHARRDSNLSPEASADDGWSHEDTEALHAYLEGIPLMSAVRMQQLLSTTASKGNWSVAWLMFCAWTRESWGDPEAAQLLSMLVTSGGVTEVGVPSGGALRATTTSSTTTTTMSTPSATINTAAKRNALSLPMDRSYVELSSTASTGLVGATFHLSSITFLLALQIAVRLQKWVSMEHLWQAVVEGKWAHGYVPDTEREDMVHLCLEVIMGTHCEALVAQVTTPLLQSSVEGIGGVIPLMSSTTACEPLCELVESLVRVLLAGAGAEAGGGRSRRFVVSRAITMWSSTDGTLTTPLDTEGVLREELTQLLRLSWHVFAVQELRQRRLHFVRYFSGSFPWIALLQHSGRVPSVLDDESAEGTTRRSQSCSGCLRALWVLHIVGRPNAFGEESDFVGKQQLLLEWATLVSPNGTGTDHASSVAAWNERAQRFITTTCANKKATRGKWVDGGSSTRSSWSAPAATTTTAAAARDPPVAVAAEATSRRDVEASLFDDSTFIDAICRNLPLRSRRRRHAPAPPGGLQTYRSKNDMDDLVPRFRLDQNNLQEAAAAVKWTLGRYHFCGMVSTLRSSPLRSDESSPFHITVWEGEGAQRDEEEETKKVQVVTAKLTTYHDPITPTVFLRSAEVLASMGDPDVLECILDDLKAATPTASGTHAEVPVVSTDRKSIELKAATLRLQRLLQQAVSRSGDTLLAALYHRALRGSRDDGVQIGDVDFETAVVAAFESVDESSSLSVDVSEATTSQLRRVGYGLECATSAQLWCGAARTPHQTAEGSSSTFYRSIQPLASFLQRSHTAAAVEWSVADLIRALPPWMRILLHFTNGRLDTVFHGDLCKEGWGDAKKSSAWKPTFDWISRSIWDYLMLMVITPAQGPLASTVPTMISAAAEEVCSSELLWESLKVQVLLTLLATIPLFEPHQQPQPQQELGSTTSQRGELSDATVAISASTHGRRLTSAMTFAVEPMAAAVLSSASVAVESASVAECELLLASTLSRTWLSGLPTWGGGEGGEVAPVRVAGSLVTVVHRLRDAVLLRLQRHRSIEEAAGRGRGAVVDANVVEKMVCTVVRLFPADTELVQAVLRWATTSQPQFLTATPRPLTLTVLCRVAHDHFSPRTIPPLMQSTIEGHLALHRERLHHMMTSNYYVSQFVRTYGIAERGGVEGAGGKGLSLVLFPEQQVERHASLLGSPMRSMMEARRAMGIPLTSLSITPQLARNWKHLDGDSWANTTTAPPCAAVAAACDGRLLGPSWEDDSSS